MSNESKTEDVAEFAAEKADSTTADAEAAQATQQTKKRRRRWGCCLAGCASPIAIIFLLFAAVIIWRVSWRNEMVAIEAEIRQRGEPLTNAEAEAYFASDGAEQESLDRFIAAATSILETKTYAQQAEKDGGENVHLEGELIEPSETVDEAFELGVQQLVDAATEIDSPILGGVHTFYSDTAFERFDLVVAAVWALRMELRAAQDAGDGDREFRAIRALFGASQIFAQEPSSTPQIIRADTRQIAKQAIVAALPHTTWTDQQLHQLILDCQKPDWRAALERTMIGERVAYLDTFDEPTQYEDWLMESFRRISHYEDRTVYLQYTTYAVESTKQPLPEVLSAMVGFLGEQERLAKGKFGLLITASLVEAFFDLHGPVSRTAVSDQATAALLAVVRYRRKYGEPPKTLADLQPDFLPRPPLDPFTGDPLYYRVNEDAVIVYSALDFEGVDGEPPEPLINGHLVFTLLLDPDSEEASP